MNRTARLMTHLAIIAGGILLSGCSRRENRISFEDYQHLEKQAQPTTPPEFQPADIAVTELHPYVIGVGDVLSATTMGLPLAEVTSYTPASVRLRVHTDGTVMLPMIGAFKLAGLTLAEAERAIYDAYVPQYVRESMGLSIFLELAAPETTTVMVVGAAGQPGPVTLPFNQRNVLYAVQRAGGFGISGSGRVTVQPIDPAQPERQFDLTDINGLRMAMVAPPLQSGDLVSVAPAETSAIYTTGLFNAPHPIAVPPDGELSLVRTVAAAGGLRDFLNPREATLWRHLPDGTQQRVKLELADILAGNAPDVALRSGDVLEVPHTSETRFREWFAQNIRFGPFGVTAMYDPLQIYIARELRGNEADVAGFGTVLRQSLRSGVPNLLIPPVPAPVVTAP